MKRANDLIDFVGITSIVAGSAIIFKALLTGIFS